jgi:hypothetical protein
MFLLDANVLIALGDARWQQPFAWQHVGAITTRPGDTPGHPLAAAPQRPDPIGQAARGFDQAVVQPAVELQPALATVGAQRRHAGEQHPGAGHQVAAGFGQQRDVRGQASQSRGQCGADSLDGRRVAVSSRARRRPARTLEHHRKAAAQTQYARTVTCCVGHLQGMPCSRDATCPCPRLIALRTDMEARTGDVHAMLSRGRHNGGQINGRNAEGVAHRPPRGVILATFDSRRHRHPEQ